MQTRVPSPEPTPETGPGHLDSAAIVLAAHQRKARIVGIAYIVVGVLCLWWFGLGSESGKDSSFGLAGAGDTTLTVPARTTGITVGVVVIFLGGLQLARGFRRRGAITTIVVMLVAFAFLAWASRGADFSLSGMLQTTLQRATPLALGAMAGVLCERAGIVNIAIEGMMLFAAFGGAVAGSVTGSPWAGLVFGLACGAVLAYAHAGLSIRFQVDQIISGTVINIFALGITSYLATRLFPVYEDLNKGVTFEQWEIPVLSDIPLIGPVLFENNIFVYALFVLVPFVTWALFRTKWGLRVRAVGEHPRAADTVGIDVYKVRYRSVALGGVMAGLAGSYLTLGSVGSFDQNMTAGRGFIALAAMIFGRWNPVGALGAALLFGFAESLQTKLAILDTPIPSQFLLMAPYVVTLFVVAGFVGRSRAPAADGQPYVKD
jgi:general nucleoside transport system permease protein